MADLSINYDLTIAKAQQIKDLSTRMLTIISKLKGMECDVQQGWQGKASDQYIVECEKLLNYLVKLDLKIAEFGDTVIKIANLIKEADEQAALAAESLSDGN